MIRGTKRPLEESRPMLKADLRASIHNRFDIEVVDAKSGELIYKPYAVVERAGMKIAFLGLITEWADKYMCEEYFEGLRVENAEMAARRWIEEIKKKENPDVVIGLFHMGASSVSKRTKSREDMAVTIARNIAGFDAIVCGHDGIRRSKTVESIIISSGIEKIDWFAFKNCPNLVSVTIPDTVNSIGYGAFDNSSKSFVIRCSRDSFAHRYAQSYGLTYDIT
jgi:hypothetical protein